ncbi:hypothetical protein LBYS11_12925 [Lysinibacillus sp. YS11]|nr:hypothetical protein LBYS11_12925 [Lysinibacillus sp. YS11]
MNATGIKEIIIVGLFAEGCVTATTLGSLHNNLQWQVQVIKRD